MTSMGTNARPAVPALIVCLKDPAADRAAFLALGALKLEPELVVPALTDMAHHPDPAVRLSAIVALSDFGPQARSALPTIRAALLDANSDVRLSATNALPAIATETLTNASFE
jgi:HEAT repeat protein